MLTINPVSFIKRTDKFELKIRIYGGISINAAP